MRILYVAPASPSPANFGGSMRVAGVLAALEKAGDVKLLVVADEPGAEARSWLAGRGATLWVAPREKHAARAARIALAVATGRSIPAARFAGGELARRVGAFVARVRPDVVVLGDTFLAEAAPALRGARCRVVVDTHNVESVLAQEIADVGGPAVRAAFTLLARNTASLERRVLPVVDRVWAASADDAVWYRENLHLAHVDVMPNVLGDAPLLGPPPEEAAVMMSGFFAYAPNEDAAMQLLAASREVTRRGVAHRLYLVGRSPGPRIVAATKDLPYVIVTGEVESVEPWLERATVFAAPLRAGSGTKFKLLQAMLAGRAVVTTPTGARGLALEDGRHALVRETWDFADALAELLADAALRRRLVVEARRHVLGRFGQHVLDRAVAESLEDLRG